MRPILLSFSEQKQLDYHQDLLFQLLMPKTVLFIERNKPFPFFYSLDDSGREMDLQLSHTLVRMQATSGESPDTVFAVYDCDVNDTTNKPCQAFIFLNPDKKTITLQAITLVQPTDTAILQQLIERHIVKQLNDQCYPKLNRKLVYVFNKKMFQLPYSLHAITKNDGFLFAMVQLDNFDASRVSNNKLKKIAFLYHMRDTKLEMVPLPTELLLKIIKHPNLHPKKIARYQTEVEAEAYLNAAMNDPFGSDALIGTQTLTMQPPRKTLKANFMQSCWPGVDLFDWDVKKNFLCSISYRDKLKLFKQILDQLIQLSQLPVPAQFSSVPTQGWSGRDIKAANVIIWYDEKMKEWHAKIIDFGYAKPLNTLFHKREGTLGYLPPEIIDIPNGVEKTVSLANDVYQAGLLWANLLNGLDVNVQEDFFEYYKNFAEFRVQPQAKKEEILYELNHLCQKTPDASPGHEAKNIAYLKNGPLNYDPTKRPTLMQFKEFIIGLEADLEKSAQPLPMTPLKIIKEKQSPTLSSYNRSLCSSFSNKGVNSFKRALIRKLS